MHVLRCLLGLGLGVLFTACQRGQNDSGSVSRAARVLSHVTDGVRTISFPGKSPFVLKVSESTGVLLELSHVSLGALVKADEASASFLSLGYPIAEFTPLRLESRRSRARLWEEGDIVRIHWQELSLSRPELGTLDGAHRLVQAWAAITYDPTDPQSLLLGLKVQNGSRIHVHQILFPDFSGLQPFKGRNDTCLHLTRDSGQVMTMYPFRKPWSHPERTPFYPVAEWRSHPVHPLLGSLFMGDCRDHGQGVILQPTDNSASDRVSVIAVKQGEALAGIIGAAKLGWGQFAVVPVGASPSPETGLYARYLDAPVVEWTLGFRLKAGARP